MFIDTHAHLFYPNFKTDLEQVISDAKENKVKYILVPATDLKTSKEVLKLIDEHEILYGAVGVHPHDTKDWNQQWLEEIKTLSKHPKIVAIGEIGLDYHYDFSPRDIQIKAFDEQLKLAVELDLPVIIHNREADKDLLEIIRKYSKTNLKAQFHCFNSTIENALELIKLNHFISFTGNITFKKAEDLRTIASKITPEHLLLETDSPFLTPVPFRGKRNEPKNVVLVAQKLAEIKHLTVDDISRITNYNAFKLFGIGEKPPLSFTYKIRNSLYINVTNRCNADCVFCDRKNDAVVSGYNLKMKHSEEPPADIYIEQIGDPKKYDEIVFCGFGEPTIRWDVIKKVAKYVKVNGGKTRLDTNGHGSFINKRDITPELKGLIDTVSISFNSADAKQYSDLMKVDENLFYEMIKFAQSAKNYVDKVVMSVVSLNEVEIEKAKNFILNQVGAEFRLREYF